MSAPSQESGSPRRRAADVLARVPRLSTLALLSAGTALIGVSTLVAPFRIDGLSGATMAVLCLGGAAIALAQGRRDGVRASRREPPPFGALMDALPDAVVIADEDGEIIESNSHVQRLFGYDPAETIGLRVSGLLAPPRDAELEEYWRELAGDGAIPFRARESLGLRKDGGVFPMEMSVSLLPGPARRQYVLTIHDITARRQALARLEVAEKVLESTMEGVMVTDRRGVILWVNQGFSRISGYTREEVLGKNAALMKSGLQPPEFYTRMWASIRASGEWEGEIWNRRKDGAAYPEWLTIKALRDSSGQNARYVGVFSDISNHKRAEEAIRTLTYYDAVTRLPNRHLFMDRLTQAIERSERTNRRVVLVMVGLDRFKQINETLGHQNGDKVLCTVAERLARSLRGHDTVARLRGDIFGCLLTELQHDHDAHPVISRLLDCFNSSIELGEHELFVNAAIGVSVCPADGTDPETLVLKAETAMNRSKEDEAGAFQFYTPRMHADSAERLRLETELRKALTRGELSVHYQPKIATGTGELVGAEALLRWQHRDMGFISPAQFIPIAEETGLITAIGGWVLDHVCGQMDDWNRSGLPLAQIAINISARQFRQPDLVERVESALATHRVAPGLIELELTESAVMRDPEATVDTLMRLHEKGVRLAVDDFGTGYSSLSYLKKFPLDKLKIDRSFVQDIGTNPASTEIVAAIVAMGHSLNLAIVAEGVETEEQLAVLTEMGCDEIQGFYYSRPVPADTFASLLRLGRIEGRRAAE